MTLFPFQAAKLRIFFVSLRTELYNFSNMVKRISKRLLFILILLGILTTGDAQEAFQVIKDNPDIAASNYYAYPMPTKQLTPAPADKRPFYISHYGRHGSRYLDNHKGYDIPYGYLHKGDSLGKLTSLGKEILQRLADIIKDAEGYWGTLSLFGQIQHRDIARRMVERFPEVFEGNVVMDAHSTIVNRCIMSMAAALTQLAAMNPQLEIRMDASQHDMYYMNHQDKQLRDSMMTKRAKAAYEAFIKNIKHNPRVTNLLFNDTAYIRENVSDYWLPYYLLKTGLMQQNTKQQGGPLVALFTNKEIHQFWQNENAWWYIMYGPSLLNGGCQPYTQRYLLRRIIADADSCLNLEHPGATLRYGHETVLLPLVCLLDLNGYGFQTMNLNEVEPNGWWACRVFPMGANLQFIFYRKNLEDKDILFKVLLNEEEATLPLPTTTPPYYRWQDFREFYLKKLDAYGRMD